MFHKIFILPGVHHFGAGHSIATAFTVKIIVIGDSLVKQNAHASVMMAVAVNHASGDKLFRNDPLLPVAHITDNRIVDIEPVIDIDAQVQIPSFGQVSGERPHIQN